MVPMQAKKGATHELYKALGQIRFAYATRNCPIGCVVPMRDENVVRALHEPYDALLVDEQVTYPGFMASTHVKILEVFAFHEPSFGPRARPRSQAIRSRRTTGARTNGFTVSARARQKGKQRPYSEISFGSRSDTSTTGTVAADRTVAPRSFCSVRRRLRLRRRRNDSSRRRFVAGRFAEGGSFPGPPGPAPPVRPAA